jgi:hypothetical protein
MKIKFNEQTEFLGRNGTFRCAGIEVQECSASARTILLCPITSKGIEGRCWIEMPKDDIPALIDALKELQ